jgi:hypothetical protein
MSYIAKIDDAPASARIGIVVEDGKFAVYVCSLDDAFNLKAAHWYSGEVGSDGSVSGISPDGVSFEGVVSGDSFTGTIVNSESRTWTFTGAASTYLEHWAVFLKNDGRGRGGRIKSSFQLGRSVLAVDPICVP